MSRFKKILGDFPTEGSIVDTITKKAYNLRSEWEQKQLLTHVNKLIEDIDTKIKEKKDENS